MEHSSFFSPHHLGDGGIGGGDEDNTPPSLDFSKVTNSMYVPLILVVQS